MISVLGAFDGFHRGHQSLFQTAMSISESTGTKWNILTFSPHPQQFFSGHTSRLLFLENEKAILKHFFSIPEIRYIKFDDELMSLSPESFMEMLAQEHGVSGVIVGDNFRFGKQRTGNIEYLEYICNKKGWIFKSLPLVEENGFAISSTTIRGIISCGNVEKARELLGYPFFIYNKVIHGDKRGRSLGFPTINIFRDPHKVVPADGVYTGLVIFDGNYRPAAINIGLNPTFSGTQSLRIEAHLLDFDGDLYDKEVLLLFMKRIRGELSFPSVDDLKYQIREDTCIVRTESSMILEEDFEELAKFIHAINNS